MPLKEKVGRLKARILDILKREKFGSSSQAISEELGVARNTVTKYLEQLQRQGQAFEWNIGRYRIWIHRDFYLYLDELKTPQDYAIYKVFRELLAELQQAPELSAKRWRAIGRALGERIDFKRHFPTDYIKTIEEEYAKDRTNIGLMASLYPFLLTNTLQQLGDANVTLDPPIIHEQPQFIIFRIRGSIFTNNRAFFELLAGIKEAELHHYYPSLTIEVLAVHEKEQIVDLQYSF